MNDYLLRKTMIALWLLLLLRMEPTGAFSSGRARLSHLQTRKACRTSREAYAASSSEEAREANLDKGWFAWSKPIKAPSLTEQEQDQSDAEAVDQYLEFLDRRYRQIHEEESQDTEQTGSFSAWKWLERGPLAEVVTTQKQQEDALYALGVAGLASKKLLQKHQMPSIAGQSVPQSSGAVIDVPVPAPEQPQMSILVREMAGRLALIMLARQRLIGYQTQKLKECGRFMFNGPLRLVRKAWAFGGGKRNMIFTAALATSLMMLIIKSVFELVFREGLNTAV